MALRIAELKVLTMLWGQHLGIADGHVNPHRHSGKQKQHFEVSRACVQGPVFPREMPTWVREGTAEGCSPRCCWSYCAGGKQALG